jgi:glycogen phosphorylase
VSASLQRIVSQFKERYGDWSLLPEKTAIHLNDTHPVVAIPELMRLLVDENEVTWDRAWKLVSRVFAYTNHTLMPEALERWDAGMFRRLLPRHEEIVCEINARHLHDVATRWPDDSDRLRRMSVFEENGGKRIHMANLAIIGSHAVNGVARLHTDLLKQRVFKDFYELWPEKFVNITNGITQRRWLYQANPSLARLITEAIGSAWITDLDELAKLEPLAGDRGFRATWMSLKRLNGEVLSNQIREIAGVRLDPQSMFDVQVKRMHEYKRQLLNVLRVVAHYLRIKDAPHGDWTPRTVLIAGKAAPGYAIAKMVIKLANDVAARINADPETGRLLKLVFLPNYGVSLAERIFPASDLSEQISTAGTEASGTGNMKFALNGALTVGTMDGANIEICETVGRENMFVFGLSEPEVAQLWANGYRPREYYESNPLLKRAVDAVMQGMFSPDDPTRFAPLMQSLIEHDPFLVFADFASYMDVQDEVDRCYRDHEDWARRSILNVARVGRFSSDRSIAEYASNVWGLKAVRRTSAAR